MKKIECNIIIGNSHTGSLSNLFTSKYPTLNTKLVCLNSTAIRLKLPNHLSAFYEKDDSNPLKLKLIDPLIDILDQYDIKSLFSMIGGNSYNLETLVELHSPFDFLNPFEHEDTILDNHHLLTVKSVLDFLETKAQAELLLLEALVNYCRTKNYTKLYHFSSPPVIDDEHYIQANLDEYYVKHQLNHDSKPITHPTVRKKIWLLYNYLFSNYCQHLEIQFIDVPIASMTPEGYLKDIFRMNATHANSQYGDILIEQFISVL